MRHLCRVFGAFLILVATGVADADPPRPRLTVPTDAKLDSQLRPRVTAPSTSPLVPLRTRGSKERVLVSVASTSDNDLKTLRRAGLRIDRVSAKHSLVRGRIRKKDLQKLAALDVVRSVKPARRGHLRVGTVTTEGDAAANAPQARATGFDGTGVIVGVISDGIDRVAQSIAADDLPAGAGLPPFGANTCAAGAGDEGTAMLEIIHDLAPGATLRFSEGISDKLQFVDSIDCLRGAGADVIVDDIGFFDEPFFEDGIVAEAVEDAIAAGVSFHSAAGNSGDVHYGAQFDATDTAEGTFHSFSAGDTFNRMTVPSGRSLACVLQWNDRFGSSGNDYDLELWDLEDTEPVLIDFGASFQDGTGDPFEAVAVFNTSGSAREVGLRVRRESGIARRLKIICLGSATLQYRTNEGSIFGHAAVQENVAVAAIDAGDFGLNDVEEFSSRGPVDIFFPSPEDREKPELAAFDGVATSICPSASVCFDPFFGTSAAAPHSAAAAALILSKNACLTPAEVRQRLMDNAVDILATGFDSASGAGRLDAFASITAPDACDDANPCTRDTCTIETGCLHTPLADGEGCPDGDLCNGNETCQAGACMAGTPPVCNDSSVCTTDSCVPAAGCVFTDLCNDGDACSLDLCDPAVGCSHAQAPDGTPCLDTDLCNGAEACQTGVCTPSAPLVCDSGPACATPGCDATRGCQYPEIEGLDGITCLCGFGLGTPACAPPASAARQFSSGCAAAGRAASASPKKQRRLIGAAARKFNKAGLKTSRAGNKGKLSAECVNVLNGTIADVLFRTQNLRGRL